MIKKIECFYSLSSPWAYLGGTQVCEIAARHETDIVLRPYEFLLAIEKTGGIPLRTRPQPRQDYHAIELERWCEYRGMPLNLKPKFYPTNNLPAGKMVIAAQQLGLDALRLSQAILRALWAEERNIADPVVRIKIAEENEMPGKTLQAAETSTETLAEYGESTSEAIRRGIFGAPTYFYGQEMFWGQDRLSFLDRRIAKDR